MKDFYAVLVIAIVPITYSTEKPFCPHLPGEGL